MEDYAQEDKEFYETMKLQKERIDSMGHLSEQERLNLYSLMKETIERYEKLKEYDLKGTAEKFCKTLEESSRRNQECLEELASTLHITKINLEISNEKMKETLRKMNKAKGMIRDMVEIVREDDRKNTVNSIIRNMRNSNQNP